MYVRDRITAYMAMLGYTLHQRGTMYYYLPAQMQAIHEAHADTSEKLDDHQYNQYLMTLSKVAIHVSNSRIEFMKMGMPGYDYNIDFLSEILSWQPTVVEVELIEVLVEELTNVA